VAALPRPPDWLIYAAVVLGIVLLATGRREQSDAPAAPPPAPDSSKVPLAPGSPFNPKKVRRVSEPASEEVGAAFSVSDAGVWLTARHVVKDCSRVAVMVADRQGVAAQVIAAVGDIAVLKTEGGAPPLPLLARAPRPGERAFHPGFPQGRPGEIATRLLGPDILTSRARGSHGQNVLAWAEVGRTDNLSGGLGGLSGAPVLDRTGQVMGVTLAESPRRARIYSSTPQAMRAALALARVRPSGFARGQAITTDNYGRAADSLRRDLSVAQVVCLT
jgi:S1-C subfamily serine protease